MNISELVTAVFSWGTLFADVVLVLFILCLVIKNGFADRTVSWVGERALGISFLLALSGLLGSLIYSEVVGFEPCILCWVQRLFLYPQVVLLGLGFWWKDKSILPYAYGLSVLGGIVAFYHSFTNLGGHSFTPCTSDGGACAKQYVLEFGYITIPVMALTIFALMIVTFIAEKKKSKIFSIK